MTDAPNATIFDYLLGNAANLPPVAQTVAEWKRGWITQAAGWKAPMDRALAGGLAADRPAWVFAAGYQAAIQRLTGEEDAAALGAVCITETGCAWRGCPRRQPG